MSDKQGHQHGPIHSPMESIPGNPKDFNATEGGVYGTVPGYPKADSGKIKEIMFDEGGAFGKVKPAKE